LTDSYKAVAGGVKAKVTSAHRHGNWIEEVIDKNRFAIFVTLNIPAQVVLVTGDYPGSRYQ
jgi:hypothetical protein